MTTSAQAKSGLRPPKLRPIQAPLHASASNFLVIGLRDRNRATQLPAQPSPSFSSTIDTQHLELPPAQKCHLEPDEIYRFLIFQGTA